jgi:hypothetical protein
MVVPVVFLFGASQARKLLLVVFVIARADRPESVASLGRSGVFTALRDHVWGTTKIFGTRIF